MALPPARPRWSPCLGPPGRGGTRPRQRNTGPSGAPGGAGAPGLSAGTPGLTAGALRGLSVTTTRLPAWWPASSIGPIGGLRRHFALHLEGARRGTPPRFGSERGRRHQRDRWPRAERRVRFHRSGNGRIGSVPAERHGQHNNRGKHHWCRVSRAEPSATFRSPEPELVGLRGHPGALYGRFRQLHSPSLAPGLPGQDMLSEWVGIDGSDNGSLIQAGVTEAPDPGKRQGSTCSRGGKCCPRPTNPSRP